MFHRERQGLNQLSQVKLLSILSLSFEELSSNYQLDSSQTGDSSSGRQPRDANGRRRVAVVKVAVAESLFGRSAFVSHVHCQTLRLAVKRLTVPIQSLWHMHKFTIFEILGKFRSQWSSGITLGSCARGPRFELRCGQKFVLSRKLLRCAALGTGCTLTAVPRSTQPSTLRGTVNEY